MEYKNYIKKNVNLLKISLTYRLHYRHYTINSHDIHNEKHLHGLQRKELWTTKNISEHLVEGKYLTIIAQPSCIPNNIYTSQNIYKTIFP